MNKILLLLKTIISTLAIIVLTNPPAKAQDLDGLLDPYISFGTSISDVFQSKQFGIGAMFYNFPYQGSSYNNQGSGFYNTGRNAYSPLIPGLEFEYKTLSMEDTNGNSITNHIKGINFYLSTNPFRHGDTADYGFAFYGMAGFGVGNKSSNALSLGAGLSWYFLSLDFRHTQMLTNLPNIKKSSDNSINLTFKLSALTFLPLLR